MILGVTSFIIDLIVLNIINYNQYNIFIFPMFTLVSLIYSIYYRKKLKEVIFILILYMSLIGIVFLPLLFFIIDYFYIKRDRENYNLKDFIIKLNISLLIFDLLFFLISNLTNINMYKMNILVLKIFVTLPINTIYILLVFLFKSVLKTIVKKYKLV